LGASPQLAATSGRLADLSFPINELEAFHCGANRAIVRRTKMLAIFVITR
jgi:hypothetical protein